MLGVSRFFLLQSLISLKQKGILEDILKVRDHLLEIQLFFQTVTVIICNEKNVITFKTNAK